VRIRINKKGKGRNMSRMSNHGSNKFEQSEIKGIKWLDEGDKLSVENTMIMTTPSQPPITVYAVWSLTGQLIAYVANNDIYIIPSAATVSGSPIHVTSNSNASLFNSVPDWVYQEEVFLLDLALWWSPDSMKVAFLHLDETLVEEYTYPIHNPTGDSDVMVLCPIML
jgi:dipeptidyl aminopeptidase